MSKKRVTWADLEKLDMLAGYISLRYRQTTFDPSVVLLVLHYFSSWNITERNNGSYYYMQIFRLLTAWLF